MRTINPATRHGSSPPNTDQAAYCRREAIRARARGDEAQAEVWLLLAWLAHTGEHIPDFVLDNPPSYIEREGAA